MAKNTFFTGQPVFSQLLNLIPRSLVNSAAKEHKADRYYKSFKAYDHLVTMLYACFHRSTSIREVVTGMQASHNKLIHLGLSSFPRRSTFAEANASRSPEFFEQVYHQLYQRYYQSLPDSRISKKLEDRLFLMDSTTISLFTDVMKGTGCPPASGKKKGGAKAHVLLKAQQDVPALIKLSHGSRNDKIFMPHVQLPQGSILVFDRGYHHFERWRLWSKQNICWVTRLIDRESVSVLEQKPVSECEKQKGVLADQLIRLGKGTNRNTIPIDVRLVTYKDQASEKVFYFLTNNNRFNASTIAGLYRKRWQIELFFKRIKQNNPLRFFLGDNENAIKIQIWCSFIADLLIKIVKDQLRKKWSFANLSGLIRHHLMNYLHLAGFLNAPDKLNIGITNKSSFPDLFAT